MTQNQIAYQTLMETKRANLAKEQENVRANKAKESLTAFDNVTKRNRAIQQGSTDIAKVIADAFL